MKINYDSKKLSSLQPSELDELTKKLEEALEEVDEAWWHKTDIYKLKKKHLA